MRKIYWFSILFITLHSLLLAQENDLKKIYTNLTTEINSALLTQKSSMEISGFISYNHYRSKFDNGEIQKQHLLHIEPVISYFVIDNLSAGLNISYQYNKIETDTEPESVKIEQTFVGPIGKYYFGEGQYRPFVFVDYLFLTGDNFKGGEIGFGAGLMYHIAGNIGLNIQAKYGQIWPQNDNIDSQNTIFIGIGLSSFIF